jgi:virginiamycin A acetyltransferase
MNYRLWHKLCGHTYYNESFVFSKGESNVFARLLFKLYGIDRRRVRGFIVWLVKKIEKGECFSITLRDIFRYYHKVDIGMYTHGGCFREWAVDPETTIGRYCSIAAGVRILTENHPMDFQSTHGFFFNPRFKYSANNLVWRKPLTIGNDVWIGYNAIIMPNVSYVGDGAVIAAGAVVNKDVPPYAVVVGNPARAVRFRFSSQTIAKLMASRWWEKPIQEIAPDIQNFQRSLEPNQDVAVDQGQKA